jgi:aminopeptidase N
VAAAIETLGDPRSRGALRRRLEHELDGRVARRIREALRNMGEDGAADRRRLNDELETLRNELGELKVRLAKLEGRKGKKAEPERERSAAPERPRGRAGRGKPKRAAPERAPKRRKLLDERGSRTS